MTHLTARDLMTPDVVSVPPETPVLAVARLLSERSISAVPVLGADGGVLGVVTEADLIRRLAGQEDAKPGWFSSLFVDPATEAERFAKTHGVRAQDIMTESVVTVGENDTAAHVAHIMEDRNIRRVFVLTEGRLRGIVSRADLLRALVAPMPEEGEFSDGRLRSAVIAAMRKQPWADSFYTLVDVEGGVVIFHGFMRDEGVRRGLRVLAEAIPGVKGVRDETQPMPNYIFAGV
ncbi:MAG: CBS domain-containing protein [Roseococcus sp.]